MNKWSRALNSVGNGFMPVSQIKASLVMLIALYAFFLAADFGDYFQMQRSVPLESEQSGGVVVLNGVKHPVSSIHTKTSVDFTISDGMEFMLLSNGKHNESFASSVFKILTCIFAIVLILQFDFGDPFNPRLHKKVNVLFALAFVIIIIDYFKFYYNYHWVKDHIAETSNFKFDAIFNFYYLVGGIWIIKAVWALYNNAVKTRQEAELTI